MLQIISSLVSHPPALGTICLAEPLNGVKPKEKWQIVRVQTARLVLNGRQKRSQDGNRQTKTRRLVSRTAQKGTAGEVTVSPRDGLEGRQPLWREAPHATS